MGTVKDTQRSTVRLSYDGKVYKTYRGPKAAERFANEIKILRYLQEKGCPFVPILIEEDRDKLQIVTTSAGNRVEHLDQQRADELFAELETYGVRHGDRDMRNITYRVSDGRFCLIDFEFAEVISGAGAGGLRQEDVRPEDARA